MISKIKNYLNNSWLIISFAIVVLILWNTNVLFKNLSKEERTKMQLWAMAQIDYIENPSGQPIDDISTLITSMSWYS